jgi:hypothetical protein
MMMGVASRLLVVMTLLRFVRYASASNPQRKYKTLSVQIIHRHGDRTTITPMKDEDFWASQLIKPQVLEKVAAGTTIKRGDASNAHKAQGRGPFGKLTQMGLFQMVELGNKLREELSSTSENDFQLDENGDVYCSAVWDPCRPLLPQNIKVISTDFERTIHSVQGTLVGLFPDGLGDDDSNSIIIDVRHTNWMIPDPQPRRTKEQEELEASLALQPHLQQREKEMYPLAVKTTNALRDLLGDDAFTVSFGVGEASDNTGEDHTHEKPLPWAQLAEITKCLRSRNLLPASITSEEQELIMEHTAWRWFESLRNPRLSYLAMHKLAQTMVTSMRHRESEPPVTLYSAHDSTLIGLICSFRLEMPSVWPKYGSYLKIELVEASLADTSTTSDDDKKEHLVRFYLNGKLLPSNWNGVARDAIPLEMLAYNIKTEGAVKAN